MGIKLDVNSAKSADTLNNGIRETGKYVGRFTRSEKLLSEKGTQGIGLSFKSKDGQTADYLDLYIENANGDILPSMKTVQAMMACMGLREIHEGLIKFEKWDNVAKQRILLEAEGYPDFLKHDIGLLIQKEIYTSNQGEDKERMIIYGVFQPSTNLTASEILDRKTNPEKLSKMEEALMARPVRDSRKSTSGYSSAPVNKPAPNFSDMDDDIPF